MLVITIINVAVKDTHAYYNSVTDPVQIFNGKVGNFKPRIDIFYIKENNVQPKYTNSNINTVYLTPGNNNRNLDQVCIIETNNISDCTNKWQSIQPSNQYNYTFANTNEEGEKVIFGFVKDRYGNKSITTTTSKDTITYDVTPPTITSVTAPTINETSLTLSIEANDTTSGISEYCYSTSDSTSESNYICGINNSVVVNDLEAGKEYSFYVYAKDKAGNSGIASRAHYSFKTKSSNPLDYLNQYKNNAKGEQTLQNNPVGGLYRYYGTYQEVTNNYICFGTSNVETCKNSPDTYMYRIIGIQKNDNDSLGLKANQLKIIKATPVKESGNVKIIAWSSANSDINWDNGSNTVRPYLNTTFLSTIDSTWQGIISNPKWYIGDNTSADSTTTEVKIPSTGNYQVGLMYASDYYNSWTYNAIGNTDSWLHITHGTSSSSTYSSQYEWTMTRYGYYSVLDDFYAWFVGSDGSMFFYWLGNTFAVRPVFYLSSNIKLSGNGTETSPFIITFTR